MLVLHSAEVSATQHFEIHTMHLFRSPELYRMTKSTTFTALVLLLCIAIASARPLPHVDGEVQGLVAVPSAGAGQVRHAHGLPCCCTRLAKN